MGFLSTLKKMNRDYKKVTRTINKIDRSLHPKKTKIKTAYDPIAAQKAKIVNFDYIQGNSINGFYDFSNISQNEVEYINLIKSASFGNSLYLIENTEGAKYKHATIANRYIELRCEKMGDCFSILATAIACKRQGASKRKKAIEYYEKFISIVSKEDLASANKIYSLKTIYRDFSKLYESEYEFEKALKLIKKAKSRSSKDTQFSCYEDMARIYSKIDINKCLDFINGLRKVPPYSSRGDLWNGLYNKYITKKENGYVFKPRNSNYSVDDDIEKQIDILARRFL